MCSPTPCQVCGGITWRGCGEHIDQVKAQVPPEVWCDGHDELRIVPESLRALREQSQAEQR